jgi:PAS domain S-box-containing protein
MNKAILTVFLLYLSIPFPSRAEDITSVNYDSCLYHQLERLLPRLSEETSSEVMLIMAAQLFDTLPHQSFALLTKTLELSKRSGDLAMKGYTRKMLGEFFRMRGETHLALDNLTAAMKILEQVGDYDNALICMEIAGSINREQEDYTTALQFFNHGIELARQQKDNQKIASFLNQIAQTRQTAGHADDAEKFYREALKVARTYGNKQQEYEIRDGLGTLYTESGRFDSALQFYLKLRQDLDGADDFMKGHIMARIAYLYSKKSEPAKSLEWNQKALLLMQKSSDEKNIAGSLIDISGNYFQLNRPDSALLYLNEGLTIAQRNNMLQLMKEGYGNLYDYLVKKRAWKEALDVYRKYASYADSLLIMKNQANYSIIEADRQIMEIQRNNDILKQQKEIRDTNLQNQKNQTELIRGLAGMAAMGIVVFLAYYGRARTLRNERQSVNEQLVREKSDLENIRQQTQEREYQYRFLTENTVDLITHLDDARERIYVSPSCYLMYGFTVTEMMHHKPADLIHADDLEKYEEAISMMLKKREIKKFIYRTRHKNGSYFWVESLLNPIFDPQTDQLREIVGVTRDITERKHRELEIMENTHQKENLLKEIHHRVKNNFAILVSLINMQIDQSKNAEVNQSLSNLQLRIRAMALVHEMLYHSTDFEKISFSDYLQSLSSVIAATYNLPMVTLTVEAEEAWLHIETAIPVGLIINEVLNNAFQHAFSADREGQVKVIMKNEKETKTLSLIIADDGVGLPAGFSFDTGVQTMGLQIVQILTRQLEGTVELTGQSGTFFRIRFPNRAEFPD